LAKECFPGLEAAAETPALSQCFFFGWLQWGVAVLAPRFEEAPHCRPLLRLLAARPSNSLWSPEDD